MSLEATLDHLIAAINANTAAILQTNGKSTAGVGAAQTPPAAGTKETKPVAPAAAAPKKDAANDVTYDKVKTAFLALASAKGRDAAVAAIAPLPTLKEVEAKEQKPGQYAALLASIEKAAA